MRQCPICKVALRIGSSRTRVTGDCSPDTLTQVFTVQELICPNPRCERYQQVIEVVEHPVKLG